MEPDEGEARWFVRLLCILEHINEIEPVFFLNHERWLVAGKQPESRRNAADDSTFAKRIGSGQS